MSSLVPLRPTLPDPPDDYNGRYFRQLMRQIEELFYLMLNPGELRSYTHTITGMKQSSSNILIGELYYDELGVVRILRQGDAPVNPATATMSLGSVTVTT